MARDVLDDAVTVMVDALRGRFDRMTNRVRAMVTDALEDANEMEEAGDELGRSIQTIGVLSTEVCRSLSLGLTAALAAAGDGARIRIDAAGTMLDVGADSDPNVLVESIIRAIGAPPRDDS